MSTYQTAARHVLLTSVLSYMCTRLHWLKSSDLLMPFTYSVVLIIIYTGIANLLAYYQPMGVLLLATLSRKDQKQLVAIAKRS